MGTRSGKPSFSQPSAHQPDLLRGIPTTGGTPQTLSVTATQVHHSGPIPPAEELRRYGEIVPNGAERIMTMAEQQQAHRLKLEEFVVTSQQMQSKRGQIIASILVGLLIASGTYLGSLGMNAVASIVFGTTILSVGATFVAGKISQAKDLKSKLEKEA
jgi:uncharacterized membrane protein